MHETIFNNRATYTITLPGCWIYDYGRAYIAGHFEIKKIHLSGMIIILSHITENMH